MDKQKTLLKSVAVVLAALVLVNGLFALLYSLDNRYASSGVQAQAGVSTITAPDVENNRVLPMAEGWLFNNSQEDGSSEVSILERGAASASQGSYSILIYNQTGAPLGMELPEIYSSSMVYINGIKVGSTGNPAAPTPVLGAKTAVIALPPGSCQVTLLYSGQGADYSGMSQPPLVGTVEGISRMRLWRSLFHGFLLFTALSLGLLAVALWVFYRRKGLYLSYGLLCLVFGANIGYLFLRWFSAGWAVFSRGPEDCLNFLFLLCLICFCGDAASVSPRQRGRRLLTLLVAALTIAAAVIPAFFLPAAPGLGNPYGWVVRCVQLLLCLYLLVSAFRGVSRKRVPQWLAAGVSVFFFGLLTDTVSGAGFSPIRFGRLPNFCGFGMLLCFSLLVLRSVRASLWEKELRAGSMLREHLQRTQVLLQEQRSQSDSALRKSHNRGRRMRDLAEDFAVQLDVLCAERNRFLVEAAKGERPPLEVISEYANQVRKHQIGVDADLLGTLTAIENLVAEPAPVPLPEPQPTPAQALEHTKVKVPAPITESIEHPLPVFNEQAAQDEEKTKMDLRAFLREAHEAVRLETEAVGLTLKLKLPRENAFISGWHNRMLQMFRQLVQNAGTMVQKGGSVTLSGQCAPGQVRLAILCGGVEIALEEHPQAIERFFSLPDGTDFRGLVEALGGTIHVEAVEKKGTAFIVVLPAA